VATRRSQAIQGPSQSPSYSRRERWYRRNQLENQAPASRGERLRKGGGGTRSELRCFSTSSLGWSRDQLQVLPSVNGRIEQNGPSKVERHADRQRERGQPLLSEGSGHQEEEGRYEADHGEDELPERKILPTASRSSFVLAGQPVHYSCNEESEDGAAEERESNEQIDDACHRPWDRLIARKTERPSQVCNQLCGRL
jgi:hypothetical protein